MGSHNRSHISVNTHYSGFPPWQPQLYIFIYVLNIYTYSKVSHHSGPQSHIILPDTCNTHSFGPNEFAKSVLLYFYCVTQLKGGVQIIKMEIFNGICH